VTTKVVDFLEVEARTLPARHTPATSTSIRTLGLRCASERDESPGQHCTESAEASRLTQTQLYIQDVTLRRRDAAVRHRIRPDDVRG